MKKFSKISENIQNKKFKVYASLEILVETENEGEAGYISDSILGGIEEQIDFRINNIEEISDEEFKKLTENMKFETQSWEEKNDKLVKTFQFENFKKSIKFINTIAELAEAANHHPEISNVYDKVTIKLTTHDSGNKITEKDKRMSQKIDSLWKQI